MVTKELQTRPLSLFGEVDAHSQVPSTEGRGKECLVYTVFTYVKFHGGVHTSYTTTLKSRQISVYLLKGHTAGLALYAPYGKHTGGFQVRNDITLMVIVYCFVRSDQ